MSAPYLEGVLVICHLLVLLLPLPATACTLATCWDHTSLQIIKLARGRARHTGLSHDVGCHSDRCRGAWAVTMQIYSAWVAQENNVHHTPSKTHPHPKLGFPIPPNYQNLGSKGPFRLSGLHFLQA